MRAELRNAIAVTTTLAALAGAASMAAADGTVYVPLGDAGEVAIVDTAKGAIVGKIEGLPAVHGLAATPDGRFLVAGSVEERELGADLPPKPAGMSEEEHASHHAPAAGTPKETVSTVSIVRTADGSVVRRIDVPGAVHHVAVSPDGRTAVVTHLTRDGISAIDLETFEVVATVATGSLPNYAAFSPDGGHVYVSNAGNATVSDVDTGRWIVKRNVVVGESPEHVVLSADGKTLFVNNVDDGTVSVVALERGEVVETIPVGSALHGIDLSEDGKTLFVAAMADDKLVAVDLAGGTARTVALSPSPYHVIALRGSTLYVSSADEPKMWAIDQDTLAVVGEIEIGGKGHQMVEAEPR
jgi:YVTN family beta-propeller protein